MEEIKKTTAEEMDGDELISRFEITFLAREEETGPVKAFLEKFGIKVLSERPIVKIALEYPIKKQLQAFLGVIGFEAKKGQIQKLTQDLNLDDRVLRFLITKFSLVSGEVRKERAGDGVHKNAEEKQIESLEKRRARDDNFQLTNEAIQRTIEEILQ